MTGNVNRQRHRIRQASLVASTGIVTILVAAGFVVSGSMKANTGVTADLPPHAYRWIEGQMRSYTLSMESEVNARRSGQTPQRIEQALEGTLHLRVFSVDSDRVRLGLQLTPLQLIRAGQDDPAAVERMSRPFIACFGTDGALHEFVLPAGLDATEEQQLHEIVSTFAVVVPAGAGSRWSTHEQHAVGMFEAQYETLGRNRILKRKTSCTEPSTEIADLGNSDIRILESSLEVWRTKSELWIDRALVREETLITADEGLKIRSSMTARLEASSRPPAAHLTLCQAYSEAELRQAAVVMPHVGLLDTSKANPTTADIARLHELVSRFESSDPPLAIVDAIADLMRRFPALTAEIPRILEQDALSDRTVGRLILALELTAHAEAQAALWTLIEDEKQTSRDQLRALVALGSLAEPTEESLKRLWSVYEDRAATVDLDRSNTAVLGIGRIAEALRTEDPKRYDSLKERLIEALHSAPDPTSTTVVLKALGNTTDATLVEHVATFLSHDHARVRTAAATALRRMDRHDTRDLLATHLEVEADSWTRAALASSLVHLGDVPVRALVTADRLVVEEDDATARLALARLLGTNLKSYPSGRERLVELLRDERDRRIRQTIVTSLLPTDSNRAEQSESRRAHLKRS